VAKPGNDRWSEGRQESGKAEAMSREKTSASVPARDKQAEEDLWRRHKAERGVWTEPMLATLERGLEGNKWFSLIDKVWSARTLELAWEKVRANAGACGVDGITIGRFAKDSQSRLLAVNEQLKRGTYQPKPVKRVWIDKPGSAEKRPLGIPTVTDRVVQAAVRMVIEPIFENRFAKHSYGFRPGCGCKDALRRVEELLRAGHAHVVDVDIRGYFDAIPHDRLMALVRERIADGRVLGLIEGFLKQGVIEGTDWREAKREGTPQGGVISPLLANIYLDPLDWLMAQIGFEMVRYADDMVVMCRSREEAAAALSALREWMEGAGLTLHPDKTRVVDMGLVDSHFDFLGYRFKRSRRGSLMRLVRPKSLRKLRETIKPETRRNNGKCMDAIVAELNRTLKGWYGYFKHAKASQLGEIDGWVRMRLRSTLRKRRGGKGRGRGRDHQRWPNRYFTNLGLFCLLEARQVENASLRQGANH
jgi:RNA-directed DNA polymerase